ncbi:7059_t:CDS:2, partial [Acaulospora morrowiae]
AESGKDVKVRNPNEQDSLKGCYQDGALEYYQQLAETDNLHEAFSVECGEYKKAIQAWSARYSLKWTSATYSSHMLEIFGHGIWGILER